MKCPYCHEFKANNKVRGYPVKDQIRRHIEVDHPEKMTPEPRRDTRTFTYAPGGKGKEFGTLKSLFADMLDGAGK